MNIKELRTELGLSQKAFAESIGMSQQSITMYESGKRDIPDHVLEKIQQIYHTAPDETNEPSVPDFITFQTGEDIKALRTRLKLSQGAFAESIGMSLSRLTNYEKKGNVPAHVLEKIQQIYHTAPIENTATEISLTVVRTGEDIKKLRTRLELSQCAFAESIGISQPSLANYENGRRTVPAHILDKIKQRYLNTTGDNVTTAKEGETEEGASYHPAKIIIQSGGKEIALDALLNRFIGADAIYVKPQDGKAYWVKDGASGSVDLW